MSVRVLFALFDSLNIEVDNARVFRICYLATEVHVIFHSISFAEKREREKERILVSSILSHISKKFIYMYNYKNVYIKESIFLFIFT